MLNISVLQVHIHADARKHRYTDTPRYPTPVPKAVLRLLPFCLTGNRAGMCHVQRSAGDGKLGMSQFSKMECDLSWCSRFCFGGVQDVKSGLLTSLAKNESRMSSLEFAHQCLMVWNTLIAFHKLDMSRDMEHTSCPLQNYSSVWFWAPDVGGTHDEFAFAIIMHPGETAATEPSMCVWT